MSRLVHRLVLIAACVIGGASAEAGEPGPTASSRYAQTEVIQRDLQGRPIYPSQQSAPPVQAEQPGSSMQPAAKEGLAGRVGGSQTQWQPGTQAPQQPTGPMQPAQKEGLAGRVGGSQPQWQPGTQAQPAPQQPTGPMQPMQNEGLAGRVGGSQPQWQPGTQAQPAPQQPAGPLQPIQKEGLAGRVGGSQPQWQQPAPQQPAGPMQPTPSENLAGRVGGSQAPGAFQPRPGEVMQSLDAPETISRRLQSPGALPTSEFEDLLQRRFEFLQSQVRQLQTQLRQLQQQAQQCACSAPASLQAGERPEAAKSEDASCIGGTLVNRACQCPVGESPVQFGTGTRCMPLAKAECPQDRPVGTFPDCCPRGSSFVDGACRQIRAQSCTGGRIGTPPNCDCPSGRQWNGASCVTVATAPAGRECPAGTIPLANGQCAVAERIQTGTGTPAGSGGLEAISNVLQVLGGARESRATGGGSNPAASPPRPAPPSQPEARATQPANTGQVLPPSTSGGVLRAGSSRAAGAIRDTLNPPVTDYGGGANDEPFRDPK